MANQAPYGCFNREIEAGYYAVTRQYEGNKIWSVQPEFIPHNMTKDCKWSETHDSDRCNGCKHDKRTSD
jgi:hypothetical protein